MTQSDHQCIHSIEPLSLENINRTTNWKDIAELVGVAAIVVSLLFVGLQLRQEQNIALAQIFADHDDTKIEWARLVAENNGVWVKGLKGEDLSDYEIAIYNSLAAAYFHMENDRYRRAALISKIEPVAITTDFAHVIHSYPGLESAWHRFREGDVFYIEAQWLKDFDAAVLSTIESIEAGREEHLGTLDLHRTSRRSPYRRPAPVDQVPASGSGRKRPVSC